MKTGRITLLDNIKILYAEVGKHGKKHEYLKTLGGFLDLSPRYIQRHFFSGAWKIPTNLQERIIHFTQKYISNLKNNSSNV